MRLELRGNLVELVVGEPAQQLVVGLVGPLVSARGCRFTDVEIRVCQFQPARPQIPVRFRQACVTGPFGSGTGGGSGSVSHVFREQGVHLVADTVSEFVADDAYSIQSGD